MYVMLLLEYSEGITQNGGWVQSGEFFHLSSDYHENSKDSIQTQTQMYDRHCLCVYIMSTEADNLFAGQAWPLSETKALIHVG